MADNRFILSAMTKANNGSCVMLYTDADPKDPELLHQVKRLITSKNLHLVSFITGKCTGSFSQTHTTFECATGKTSKIINISFN